MSQIILSPIEGLYSLKGIPVHNIPFLRCYIVKLCTLFQTQHPENIIPSPNQQHLPVKAKNGSAPPPSPDQMQLRLWQRTQTQQKMP